MITNMLKKPLESQVIRNGGPKRKSYLESFATVIYGRHPWAICSISDVSNLDHTKHLMLIHEDCQISS